MATLRIENDAEPLGDVAEVVGAVVRSNVPDLGRDVFNFWSLLMKLELTIYRRHENKVRRQ